MTIQIRVREPLESLRSVLLQLKAETQPVLVLDRGVKLASGWEVTVEALLQKLSAPSWAIISAYGYSPLFGDWPVKQSADAAPLGSTGLSSFATGAFVVNPAAIQFLGNEESAGERIDELLLSFEFATRSLAMFGVDILEPKSAARSQRAIRLGKHLNDKFATITRSRLILGYKTAVAVRHTPTAVPVDTRFDIARASLDNAAAALQTQQSPAQSLRLGIVKAAAPEAAGFDSLAVSVKALEARVSGLKAALIDAASLPDVAANYDWLIWLPQGASLFPQAAKTVESALVISASFPVVAFGAIELDVQPKNSKSEATGSREATVTTERTYTVYAVQPSMLENAATTRTAVTAPWVWEPFVTSQASAVANNPDSAGPNLGQLVLPGQAALNSRKLHREAITTAKARWVLRRLSSWSEWRRLSARQLSKFGIKK